MIGGGKSWDLPPPPKDGDPQLTRFMLRVKEELQRLRGNRGDELDRAVTLRDLQQSGLATFRPGATLPGVPGGGALIPGPNAGVGGAPPYVVDLTPPPTPSGVTVSAGIDFLFIRTDAPVFPQGNGYLRTKVYGAQWPQGDPEPVFADAVLVHEFSGTVGSFGSNPNVRWAIWLTWETRDEVESATPSGGTNGHPATTGQDVSSLLEALTLAATTPGAPYSQIVFRAGTFAIAGEPVDGLPQVVPFIVNTVEQTENGVTIPPGVYMDGAYVRNLTAAVARLGDAWVTNAMVQSLSADKLTAGSIDVGAHIQSSNYVAGTSGWRINGDGTAEMNNVIVRGSVRSGQSAFDTGAGFYLGADGTMSVGNSSGPKITWNGTQLNVTGAIQVNGVLNFGNYTGYAWPPAGQNGAHLSASGLLLGNANNGRYFQVTADGQIYAPQFSIVNGNATFAGNLSAAGGTFSGTLTASAVNAVNTINLAGEAVTVPRSMSAAAEVALSPMFQWFTIASVFMPSLSGQAQLIIVTATARALTTTTGICQWRVLRNGVQIALGEVAPFQAGGDEGSGPSSFGRTIASSITDTPPAGNYTYEFQARSNSSLGGLCAVSNRGLAVLGTRR